MILLFMMNMLSVHSFLSWMANVYLIENEAGLYLVDACAPGYHPQILKMIRECGKDLKLIYITHAHFDHYGSAAVIRQQTGAQIAIHCADAHAMALGRTPIRSARGRGRLSLPFLPLLNAGIPPLKTEADILLKDGDRLDDYGLPAVIVHTPGHTAGSSSLLVDNGHHDYLAFSGDLVVGGQHPHLQNLYAEDWSQMSESLSRLQAFRPQLTYPGHGSHPFSREALLSIQP